MSIAQLTGFDEGNHFSTLSSGEIAHGSEITGVQCKSGYTYNGQSSYRCDNGSWWTPATQPHCEKPCGNFPVIAGNGTFVYSDAGKDSHPPGSQITALSCAPGYISEGFAPLTCKGGWWEGDQLGVCTVDNRIKIKLAAPLVPDASFYIYLLVDNKRVAGYLINAELFPSFKDKVYTFAVRADKTYQLGIECGDFRSGKASKNTSTHERYESRNAVVLNAGEHLQVSCGEMSSDRQGSIPLEHLTQ